MPVSRFDITEFVGDAFADGPIGAATLVRVAQDRGARPAVLNTLRRLPHRSFERLDDLFDALPGLPVDADPWTESAGYGAPDAEAR